MIFGTFLWVSTAYLTPAVADRSDDGDESQPASVTTPPSVLRIPCQQDGGKIFVTSEDVVFVRADGHYTQVFTKEARHFCAWSITEANKRLIPQGFIRVHRSYVVNPLRVANFERSKDRGACHFDGAHLPPAPVSRANLRDVQDRLAANAGAVRVV